MKRVAATIAVVAWFVSTSIAKADTQTWDYTSSYSSTTNAVGAGQFAGGYLSGPEGTFNVYNHYSDDSSYEGINRWDDAATGTDFNGNAGMNTNATAKKMTDWGTGGMYFEAGATALMPAYCGNWAAVRWTAPEAGQYRVNAVFTDQCLDAGASKKTTVYMREGKVDGSLFWTNTLAGFVGTKAASFGDATGTNQSATYNDVLTFTAGQAVDVVVAAGDTQYLMTGITFTVTAVPEPSAITVVLSGLLGFLAYAWKKRR
jgi:hypothetical protein